ncbi:MAG: Gldg family protein [Planctomycetota bacterium]|nr:Gldg family protein [Planctomycetota bacterium]
MFRPHVISAIASRNIKTFFTSVIGYLFIVVFVVVSGIIAFGPKFFADNLATLDQLTNAYPMLLLFLIPAITMGIWSDEKKQGTDAILFTLPASDAEILFGKFFSVVVVYIAALFFSLTQLVALASIGIPDWGIILSTYVGYLLAGVSLLSIGMFASSLTSNTTVAFVLGALFSALPVFIGVINPSNQFLLSLSLEWQLREFGQGSIALPNVLYFLSLATFGLFLNLVVITKRHWSSEEENKLYGLYVGQVVSILIIAGSFYFIALKTGNYYDTEVDLTAQGVNTLSRTSIDVIGQARNNRKVDIQAFVSDDVPTEFVATKKRLMRLLRQYSQLGGEKINLRVVNITPNSKFEKEAKDAGIERIDHTSEVGGREIRQDIYLGLKFSSSIGEAVIPTIDADTPLEYEMTRALGTTGVRQKKLRLGVLDTHASYLGMVNGLQLNHTVVEKLEQRYELVRVSESDLTRMVTQQRQEENPEAKNEEDSKEKEETKEKTTTEASEQNSKESEETAPKIIIPDVLLVVRPSRVSPATQQEIVSYMDRGNPTVFMVDPLPVFPFSVLASEGSVPETPKQRIVASMQGFRIEEDENNDCSTLFDALQIKWYGYNQSVTYPEQPPQPNQFGGPPQGGRPERTTEAFYPTVVAQSYRPFEELRFDDLTFTYGIEGQKPVEINLDLSDEREGIPVSLGSPNAMMINSLVHGDFDPFNRKSQMTSGIDNVLMFYAGAIAKKANPGNGATSGSADSSGLTFVPLIHFEEDAIGLPWESIIKTENREVPSFPPRNQEVTTINPEPDFYKFELAIEDIDKLITEAEKESRTADVSALQNRKASLETQRDRYVLKDACVAAHISGQRTPNGNTINAVVIGDADFASNLYGAVEVALKKKPDNIEFLLNVFDTLGGREEFVSLRGRNPVQRTLTYMDRKKDEYGSVRIAKEQQMKRDMRKEVVRITNEQERKNEKNQSAGIARLFQLAEGAMDADKKIQIEKQKLQDKLDEDIAGLKAEEDRNLKETEQTVRLQATILPCLPALILGILVFIFRFVQERKLVGEKR